MNGSKDCSNKFLFLETHVPVEIDSSSGTEPLTEAACLKSSRVAETEPLTDAETEPFTGVSCSKSLKANEIEPLPEAACSKSSKVNQQEPLTEFACLKNSRATELEPLIETEEEFSRSFKLDKTDLLIQNGFGSFKYSVVSTQDYSELCKGTTEKKPQTTGNINYSHRDFVWDISESGKEEQSKMGSCGACPKAEDSGEEMTEKEVRKQSKKTKTGPTLIQTTLTGTKSVQELRSTQNKRKVSLSSEDYQSDKRQKISPSPGKRRMTQSQKKKTLTPRDSKIDRQPTWSPQPQEVKVTRGQERNEKVKPYKRYTDRDTEIYRKNYPGKEDSINLNENLKFYRGEIQSKPNGDYIDEIHSKWWGKYEKLEMHHGYIQWLFPIRESGMNYEAQPLQPHEAKAIQTNPVTSKRVLKSYELMLDFYGMKLINRETGCLERAANWQERFNNLNQSPHNYLRITRILKCLGELGFEHLKEEFIRFLIDETLKQGALNNTVSSCRNYWIGTIRDDETRKTLYKRLDKLEGK